MTVRSHTRRLLLADDDIDDTSLFQEALADLPFPTQLSIVANGQELLQFLKDAEAQLPDLVFMDLNMPRKNGFQCLDEIRRTESLMDLPVIIFTTSYDLEIINQLYRKGAQYYIRKPNNYEQLKRVIHLALLATDVTVVVQPPIEGFVLSPDSFKG